MDAVSAFFILGMLPDLSVSSNFLLTVLGASASYIAVSAAMSTTRPNDKRGVAMNGSLGISFPFNVIVGIPLYLAVIHQVAGGGS